MNIAGRLLAAWCVYQLARGRGGCRSRRIHWKAIIGHSGNRLIVFDAPLTPNRANVDIGWTWSGNTWSDA